MAKGREGSHRAPRVCGFCGTQQPCNNDGCSLRLGLEVFERIGLPLPIKETDRTDIWTIGFHKDERVRTVEDLALVEQGVVDQMKKRIAEKSKQMQKLLESTVVDERNQRKRRRKTYEEALQDSAAASQVAKDLAALTDQWYNTKRQKRENAAEADPSVIEIED